MRFYFYVNSNEIEALHRMISDNNYLEECDALTLFYNKNEASSRVMFSVLYDDYMRLLDSSKINFV